MRREAKSHGEVVGKKREKHKRTFPRKDSELISNDRNSKSPKTQKGDEKNCKKKESGESGDNCRKKKK